MADQKNLFLAIALSLVILITWNVLVEQPNIERDKAAFEQKQAEERAAQEVGTLATNPSGQAAGLGAPVTGPATQRKLQSSPQLGAAPSARGLAAVGLSRSNAILKAPRIQIDTPRVRGSISLAGARLDDLTLKDYRVSLDKNSEQIEVYLVLLLAIIFFITYCSQTNPIISLNLRKLNLVQKFSTPRLAIAINPHR